MNEELLQQFLEGEFVVHICSNEEANILLLTAEGNISGYQDVCNPYTGKDYLEFPYVVVEDNHHCNGYRESRVQRDRMNVIEFADLYASDQQFNIDLEDIL